MLLDTASHACRGPVDRIHLAQEEIQLLSRTILRTRVDGEVLTKGGRHKLGRRRLTIR